MLRRTVLGKLASTASRTRSCRNPRRSPSSVRSPAAIASLTSLRSSSGGRPSSPASSSREKLCPSTEAISTASLAGAVSRASWPATEPTSRRGRRAPAASLAVPPSTVRRFSVLSPRSSSVSRNGWPSARLSTSRSASSGSPPSMSRATCATAASSRGPSRISDAPADSSRPTASCAASASSPRRSASSQLIWCVASRLDSVTRALAVAASAHCRSSTTTSSGARRAAFSSASCSSRSSQNRWSGDWLSS